MSKTLQPKNNLEKSDETNELKTEILKEKDSFLDLENLQQYQNKTNYLLLFHRKKGKKIG